ncbi:MAG: hypothetical protein ACOYBM_00765 [Dethiobacteria bacterium]
MHLADELQERVKGEKTIKIPRHGMKLDTWNFYVSEVDSMVPL